MSELKHPTYVPEPQVLPAPEKPQQITLRPGSGLAVIGVFVEVIRKRFSPDIPGLPWTWNDDIKKTKIAIESAFNEDKDHRDFRPAIYVDRDEQILGRTVIGDFAGQQLTSGLRGFWALQTVPILIECVAAKKAESAVIADVAGIFLHASSDLIQGKFGFHDMTPVTIGRTQPFPRDKTQWVTPILFNVQYDLRWTNKPTGPLLAQIEAAVTASGSTDATQYFEQLALWGALQPK